MLQFDKLELSQDGKTLTIVASVQDLSYYQDILIKSLTIDTQDTFSINGPSTKPIYRTSFGNEIGTGAVKGLREINVDVPISVLSTDSNNLLYVYLEAVGTPTADTPCGMDNPITLGIVYNESTIYNEGMNYIKQIEKSCEIPKGFIDYILRYKALELTIKTKNYVKANEYWNKFFKGNKVVSLNTNNCGCT